MLKKLMTTKNVQVESGSVIRINGSGSEENLEHFSKKITEYCNKLLPL
jgi:hypothetical protein